MDVQIAALGLILKHMQPGSEDNVALCLRIIESDLSSLTSPEHIKMLYILKNKMDRWKNGSPYEQRFAEKFENLHKQLRRAWKNHIRVRAAAIFEETHNPDHEANWLQAERELQQ